MSQRKEFTCSPYDDVILLRSLDNLERRIKVLHVKPVVKVGEVIEIGEELEVGLKSGFFDFWTDPHLHIEVRKPSDPIRARGGSKFKRSFCVDELDFAQDLSGTVIKSKPDYFLGFFRRKVRVRCTR